MKTKANLDPALEWAKETYLAKDIYRYSDELAKTQIRKTLLVIAEDLLKQTNQNVPFDPEIVAPLRRVNRIIDVPLFTDALLVPESGGFTIKVKKSLHPFRKRFAVAHEIGHTFFFNINTNPPRREFQNSKSSYWVQEDISSAIARAILVPQFSIKDVVVSKSLQPSIDAVRYLSGLYQVSFDVLRRRLISDIPIWDCLILISTLSENKVKTKTNDISKGESHRDFVVPREISWNSKFSNMFYAISSTLATKRVEDKIRIEDKLYRIESYLTDEERKSIISVLQKC